MPNKKPPFYKGEAKTQKLDELAEEANRHHAEAFKGFRISLEHARGAGLALAEAKRILGRRGKWGRWRRANFKSSAETARVYVRIAAKWDDPRLVKAREEGYEPQSMAAFLRLIRNQKEPTAKEVQAKAARAFVRWLFSERLAQLTDDEVCLLQDAFEYFWGKIEVVLKAEGEHPAMYAQLIRNRFLPSADDLAGLPPDEAEGSAGFWRGLGTPTPQRRKARKKAMKQNGQKHSQ